MYRLSDYFNKVSDFDGYEFAESVVPSQKITRRVLLLVVPKGSVTDTQRGVIEAMRSWATALTRNVDLVITEF